MRDLIVHGTTLMVNRDDNIPDCRQVRAVVATRTKKEAAAAFGLSYGEFIQYSSPTGNAAELEIALANPGQVFARSVNNYSGKYTPIVRKPHVVIPRTKRSPISNWTPPPKFNKEELESIAERFQMANDPIGKSIAEKAQQMLNTY